MNSRRAKKLDVSVVNNEWTKEYSVRHSQVYVDSQHGLVQVSHARSLTEPEGGTYSETYRDLTTHERMFHQREGSETRTPIAL